MTTKNDSASGQHQGSETGLPTIADVIHAVHRRNREEAALKLPELHPDDIVLMADSLRDLRAVMTGCGQREATLGLGSSTRKSALMRFEGGVELEKANRTIQGNPLPWDEQYKHIEVCSHTGHNYLIEQESKLQAKTRKSHGIATVEALWR